jgi:adenylate cyclase
MRSQRGVPIGVIEVVNRRGGVFRERDELRLRSLAAQAAVAVDNARLLDAVLDEKSYSDSILASLTDGVISLDTNLRVARVNPAGCRVLGWSEDEVRGKTLSELLPDPENDWEIELVERVARTGRADTADDADLVLLDGKPVSVNLNAIPLRNAKGGAIGSLFVVEDITADKRVRGTMARYLPKKIIDQLLGGDRAALGGSAQVVTALFSDIRSFTTISEEIGPRETVAMLNEYFTDMIEVLDRHNGVLDKYIGDAIMALFGVPFVGDDDATNAVAAANDMMASLARLNEVRASRGQPAIAIGAGLNTGEAVAGNIGSPKRMSYTVIGDSVNLASRLEGATKQYGVSILLSEFTFAALKDRSYLREVDLLRVKGKTKPVGIYESFAYRPDRDSDRVKRAADLTTRGIAAYRGRRWAEARTHFGALHDLATGDRIARLYLDRVQRFEAEPPPDDWDGVWVMTSK